MNPSPFLAIADRMTSPKHGLHAVSFAFLLAGCATGAVSTQSKIADLQIKAHAGNLAAQFELGALIDNGPNDISHDAEAAAWYRKAAEQGHAAAQNSLGSMYQAGQGVPEDAAEAVRWYQLASDQDDGEAHANLGYMYDFGLGIGQDKQKARQLYQKAVERGSVVAMLHLGVLYRDGEGGSRDLVQAHMWLDLARFYTQLSSDMRLKWRARGLLDQLKKEMTRNQIREAEKLAMAWDAARRPR